MGSVKYTSEYKYHITGKRKKDYRKVFKAVRNLLPNIVVHTVTLHFEAAMWQAIRVVFPAVAILGCYFHCECPFEWGRMSLFTLGTSSHVDEQPVRGCGRDKLSDPMSAYLKQEIRFQNIEYMAKGCQQPGFHSFHHRKG